MLPVVALQSSLSQDRHLVKTCRSWLTPHRTQHCPVNSQEHPSCAPGRKRGRKRRSVARRSAGQCGLGVGNLWNCEWCRLCPGIEWEMTMSFQPYHWVFSLYICKVLFFFSHEHISHRCLIIFSNSIYHSSFCIMKTSQSTSGMFTPRQCRQALSFVWWCVSLYI